MRAHCDKKWRVFWRILTVSLLILFLSFAATFSLYLRFPIDYRETAKRCHPDWRLVLSVIKAESNFSVTAVSRVGACGLMQLMPETASFIAAKEGIGSFDLFDAEDNILLGCRYLLYLQKKFPDRDAMLAAYNAGEGKVREWLQNTDCSADGQRLNRVPFAETREYLQKVKKYYRIYGRIYLTKK